MAIPCLDYRGSLFPRAYPHCPAPSGRKACSDAGKDASCAHIETLVGGDEGWQRLIEQSVRSLPAPAPGYPTYLFDVYKPERLMLGPGICSLGCGHCLQADTFSRYLLEHPDDFEAMLREADRIGIRAYDWCIGEPFTI